jgi:hypothetical protein
VVRLAREGAVSEGEGRAEAGDFVEPGSAPDLAAMPAAATGGAAHLEQMKGLRDAGLIDAETFELIERSLANAPAGAFGAGSFDAAEMQLLQHGEPAAATVLTVPAPADEAGARLALKLEVHPAAGSPYPADCTIPALHPGAELKVGDFLRVKVDPGDPGRVAVDWAGFGP